MAGLEPSTPVRRPWSSTRREEVEEIAREIGTTIRTEIPAYAAMWSEELAADVVEANVANVSVYLRCLDEDRDPRTPELEAWEAAARRRVRQGLPLEAVLRANRIALRVAWERTADRVPRSELTRAGSRTLQYIDFISSAAERAYVKRRDELPRSMEQATQLFVSRLVTGAMSDETAIRSEAQLLGHDLTRVRVAVQITPSVDADRVSETEPQLQDLLQTLRSGFPGSLWAWELSSLFLAVPAASSEDVEKLACSAIRCASEIPVKVGIGSPRVGGLGLRTSFQEAQAARVLGAMLRPGIVVHRYEDVRMFDVFKHGEPIDAFVEAVLGPLLADDREHRTHTLQTLHAFFLCGMNRKSTAARLGIHRNTLNYRLEGVERLMGVAIASGEASFRIQLALRLIPMSSWATILDITEPGALAPAPGSSA